MTRQQRSAAWMAVAFAIVVIVGLAATQTADRPGLVGFFGLLLAIFLVVTVAFVRYARRAGRKDLLRYAIATGVFGAALFTVWMLMLSGYRVSGWVALALVFAYAAADDRYLKASTNGEGSQGGKPSQ
ncbi:MAG: hypothetical protein SGI84_08620 [Gemmatimonadota bacterium]|nr:hypothetical protein [Gemmatimonadota bacterium]